MIRKNLPIRTYGVIQAVSLQLRSFPDRGFGLLPTTHLFIPSSIELYTSLPTGEEFVHTFFRGFLRSLLCQEPGLTWAGQHRIPNRPVIPRRLFTKIETQAAIAKSQIGGYSSTSLPRSLHTADLKEVFSLVPRFQKVGNKHRQTISILFKRRFGGEQKR